MAVVAICGPALDWPGGRDRGREGDTTSLVRTLGTILLGGAVLFYTLKCNVGVY